MPGREKRVFDDAGKRSEPNMDRFDVHACTPLGFFLRDFQNAKSDGEFMHGLPQNVRRRQAPLGRG